MNLQREDLEWAVEERLLAPEQAEPLWHALQSRNKTTAKFDLAHLAYYFGAMIVISAMGWFMTLGWETFGGGGILLISCIYALCFALAGYTLWFKQNLCVPGGLLFTLAVWMTPLAIYGLERMLGWWPEGDPGTFRDFHVWIRGSWILMELTTVVAGLLALRRVRFPFLTFPVAFALWYMSMDLTPLLLGRNSFNWNGRLWVSLFFGLVMLVAAYVVDRRTREDFAFWLYLFGMSAFWGGLSLMESGSELNKFLYCLLNVGLMIISVLLDRRIFIVFGSFGVFGYLGYLSWRVFKNSMLFPCVLTLLGILIIFFGVQYQRHRDQIEGALVGLLPDTLKELLPKARMETNNRATASSV